MTEVILNRPNTIPRLIVKAIPKPAIKFLMWVFFEPPIYMNNTIKNGKGSNRRPMQIKPQEFSNNWEVAFGKKEIKKIATPAPEVPIEKQLKNSSAVATD